MGSVHNDLHCWAAKARRQGRDTIEIDVDTADRAAEQIVDLSNRVMDLEHEIRSAPAADADRVRIAVEALEKIEANGERVTEEIASEALAALKSTAGQEGGCVMPGEAKILIVLAAIVASAVINVTAEHFLGWQVRTGTGMMVGALLIRLWPSFAGLQRKGETQ